MATPRRDLYPQPLDHAVLPKKQRIQPGFELKWMYNIREQERLHQQRRVAARLARQASTANKNQVCREASSQSKAGRLAGRQERTFVVLVAISLVNTFISSRLVTHRTNNAVNVIFSGVGIALWSGGYRAVGSGDGLSCYGRFVCSRMHCTVVRSPLKSVLQAFCSCYHRRSPTHRIRNRQAWNLETHRRKCLRPPHIPSGFFLTPCDRPARHRQAFPRHRTLS